MIQRSSILWKLSLGTAILFSTGCAKNAPSFQDSIVDAPVSSEASETMGIIEVVEDDLEDSIEDDANNSYAELADAGTVVVDGNELAELGIRAVAGDFDLQMFPEGSSDLWAYLYHCIQNGMEGLEIGHHYGYGGEADATKEVMPVVFSMTVSDDDGEDWRFYQSLMEFVDVEEVDFLEMALTDGTFKVAEMGMPTDYSVREFEIAWVMNDENNQPRAYSVSHTVALDEVGFNVVCSGASAVMFVLNRYLARTGMMDVMVLNTLATGFGSDEAETITLYDNPITYYDFSFGKVIEVTRQ